MRRINQYREAKLAALAIPTVALAAALVVVSTGMMLEVAGAEIVDEAVTNAKAGPAEAAIAHLKDIAEQEVNLEVGGDTAISPHVGPAKRREIAGLIERMALDVNGGDLEVGDVRMDGDLAGVIVHRTSGYDPSKVAVFALAFVRTDGTWVPAPVPASFENTTVALDRDLKRSAKTLEIWMLRERALAHGRLQDQLAERMRNDIGRVLTRDQLVSMSMDELGDFFLKACMERDQGRLLGLMGGLSDPLPDDWVRRMRVVHEVVTNGERLADAWRAVTSRQVLRTIVAVAGDEQEGFFEIGYIDPAADVPRGGVPEVRLIQIKAERDGDGRWRLELPTRLLALKGEPGRRGGGVTDPDPELQKRFAERHRRAHPPTPQASPEALWGRMMDLLAADSPAGLMQLLFLPKGDADTANQALGRASRFWWQVAEAGGGRHPVSLEFREAGDEAMVMVQLFAFREPERTDLRALHLIRQDGGWMWNSTGRKQAREVIHPDLVAWRSEMEVAWRDRWVEPMLEPVARLKQLEPDRPVAAAAAERLARALLDEIAAGDLEACLGRCAVLDDKDGHGRLLRNLGYELSTRLTDIEGDMVTRVGKHWTVVAFRRRDDVNPGMALLPMLTAPDGPRVLMELDLFVGTRQRDFLNNAALERLQGYANAEVQADLRGILKDLNREFGVGRR